MEIILWPFFLLSIVVAAAVYLWLGNIWASLAAWSFFAGMGLLAYQCSHAMLAALQLEMRARGAELSERLNGIPRRLDEIHVSLLKQLDTLAEIRSSSLRPFDVFDKMHSSLLRSIDTLVEMAEFVGEQSFPNFVITVKKFKAAQAEAIRAKAEAEGRERAFKEALDASVNSARIQRENEAKAARERRKQAHQTDQKEE